MAISDKLQTVSQSCLDIRQAMKSLDPTFGAGNISTLDDEIRAFGTRPKAMCVCRVIEKGKIVYKPFIVDSNNGSFPSLSSSNTLLPGPIVYIIFMDGTSSMPSFEGQRSMEYVHLSSGATSIGSFINCSSLKEIIIPRSATSVPTFQNCSSLKYVDMSNFNGSLPGYMFQDCPSLEVVKMGTSTTQRTVTGLFRYCSSLTKIYGLENLRFSAYNFVNCYSLSEVHVSSIEAFLKNIMYATSAGYRSPFSASSAESRGIYINNQLVVDVVVPNTITTINIWAFNRINTIETVILPNTVTGIGNEAFYGCSALRSITIPNSVTTIGSSAFNGCTSLVDLTIPAINSRLSPNVIENSGNGTGTLTILGDVVASNYNGDRNIKYKHIYIDTATSTSDSRNLIHTTSANVETLRVGEFNSSTYSNSGIIGGTTRCLKFIEVKRAITGSAKLTRSDIYLTDAIAHLEKADGIACTPSAIWASSTYLSKIYVGTGASQAADQATLDLYLADTDWAQYSSKLDLWSNYNGEYKIE